MVTIRRFEEALPELYTKGLLAGGVHQCIGQEAVPVGVSANLRNDDYITGTHRGHGYCLAKGAQVDRMMAELFGKEKGYNRGRSGSYHFAIPEIGAFCTGIVGGGIPLAVGAALSFKIRGTEQVAVSFFGDGASNEGIFHESLNMAALWKLPIVFVCENNQYGTDGGPVSKTTSVRRIADRAKAYNMPGLTVDGMDVMAVYEAAERVIKEARENRGPTLIEFETYRFVPHSVMSLAGQKAGIDPRPSEEIEKWKKRDPINSLKRKLIEMNVLTEEEVEKIEEETRKAIDEAISFSISSSYAAPETIKDYLY